MNTADRQPDRARRMRTERGLMLQSTLFGLILTGLLALYAWPRFFLPASSAEVNPPAPAQRGAGAPILVVKSTAAPMGDYYAEILHTEGLNAFDVADIATVTPARLAAYDLVLLARMPLSGAQAAMFSDWVEAGGNLVAMAPDRQLAGLLGLLPTGRSLANAYLLVDTATAVGGGIVGQTVQFHGAADLYRLDGASPLATLYRTAKEATPHPALTWRRVGGNGGQAAAFTYDLATSVVLTRQGNPAWAKQERDGRPAIRPNDLFYGAAADDPQPDWIDMAKIAIPQADEQQRLLAKLILQMNLDKKPLPRFWYFPNGKRAVVVMTGDDHGNGGTATRFSNFILRSPAGCSVSNWECVRGTSYIYPETPLSAAQAEDYAAQGFEVALHVDTGCHRNYTPASLDAIYKQQLAAWRDKYAHIPAPASQRHHCVIWSDWATGARTQAAHAMRLDVTYYYWPRTWVNDTPGVFTGSAMPMRFADLDGTVIDVYGAATQMTDESGQSYPYTVDTLLDRALGKEEYFGAYTVNAHTDRKESAVADAVVTSAQKRGVPVVSARQMLTWLDGRNASSFGALHWNGKALRFTVTPGKGAHGLQALLPLRAGDGGVLTGIARDGAPLAFTATAAKGMAYAAFPAAAGSYVATYAPDPATPVAGGRPPRAGQRNLAQGG